MKHATAQVERLEFDANGFRELLESAEIRETLDGIAQGIRRDAAANSGLPESDYVAEVTTAKGSTRYKFAGRAIGIVACDTPAAMEAQAINKTLSTAAVQPREV